jgi:cell division protein ZapA
VAQVTIKINGYAYTVGCEDGQESHLQAMAGEIEKRIDRVKALGGQSGESRLLVLAGLLMADELHDLARAPAPAPVQGRPVASGPELRALAERAEHIAATIEHD